MPLVSALEKQRTRSELLEQIGTVGFDLCLVTTCITDKQSRNRNYDKLSALVRTEHHTSIEDGTHARWY